MKKSALHIIILSVLSKFVGFGREMVLAYYYGASSISDVYIIAFTIPGSIFAFIANGITTVFIPMYTKIEKRYGANKADLYTSKLINILFFLCTFLVLSGLIFAKPMVRLFALGFEGDVLSMAIWFTRISILGIYFTAMVCFLQVLFPCFC